MSFYPTGKKIFSDWKEILSWNIENLIRIKEKHRPRLNTPPLSKAVKSIIQIERVIRIKGTLYRDANQWFTRHGFRRALTIFPLASTDLKHFTKCESVVPLHDLKCTLLKLDKLSSQLFRKESTITLPITSRFFSIDIASRTDLIFSKFFFKSFS